MASAKKIGGIAVAIVADTAKFVKGIAGAQTMLGRFASSATRATKTIALFAAGLSGAAAAGLTYFTKQAAHAIDDLAKTADKLGITTEALAGLQLAAGEAGIENATLSKALQTLAKNTSNTAHGIGSAADAYKRLGLDAAELNNLSPDQQLLAIADALPKVRNQQDQLNIVTKLFGSRAASMLNVLRGGRGVLEEAAQAAKDLGLAVDRESAAGVERAIDAYERFKVALQGIFRQIAVTVAPVIELINKKLVAFLAQGGRGASWGQGIGKIVIEVFKKIGDGFQSVIEGFLQLIADVKFAIIDFRTSKSSTALGLGYKSKADRERAEVSAANSDFLAYSMSQKPRFSSLVDSLVSEANKRRAANPGRGLSGFAGDIGEGIAKRLGMAARTAKDFGMSALGGIGSARNIGQQFLAQLPFLAGQKAAMDFANRPSGVNQNALSLADANSREGFSQRVAAMRATENIGKKSLKVQEQTRDGITQIAKKIANGQLLVASNF